MIGTRARSDETAAPPSESVAAPAAERKARGPAKAKVVRLKGPRDLMDTVISKINAGRPKGPGARQIDFEVSRSTKGILSKVRYVLSTGMEPYDAALGIGGLPFGRVTELYGTDGSGKTAMALRCAVRLQQRFIYERIKVEGTDVCELRRVKGDVPVFTVYIDNEQSIDEDGKTKIDGTQLDVAVARCDTVDQMFKIIDTAIDTVDSVMEELRKDAKKNGEPVPECFIGITVDTIAGTSSREEMTDKWDKVDYSRQAKQLREGFRIMMRKFSRRNVLGIFTNQVGDKFDKQVQRGPKSSVAQDSDFNTFGGRALKFFASIRIFHAQQNANYKLDKAYRFPSGRSIAFKVVKNRLGKPYRGGQLVLLYDGGFSNIFSKLETLLGMKLAEYGDREAGETGIKFRFATAKIETTTFPPVPGERTRTPALEGSLASWPAFYEEHRADFDRLWQHAVNLMQNEQSSLVEPDSNDPDLDETASEVDHDED